MQTDPEIAETAPGNYLVRPNALAQWLGMTAPVLRGYLTREYCKGSRGGELAHTLQAMCCRKRDIRHWFEGGMLPASLVPSIAFHCAYEASRTTPEARAFFMQLAAYGIKQAPAPDKGRSPIPTLLNQRFKATDQDHPLLAVTCHRDAVYLIQNTGSRRYKIGISQSVSLRIKTLQCGNDQLLRLVACAEVDRASWCEATLHKRFAHRRVLGEWFELDQEEIEEVISFLVDHALPPN